MKYHEHIPCLKKMRNADYENLIHNFLIKLKYILTIKQKEQNKQHFRMTRYHSQHNAAYSEYDTQHSEQFLIARCST